MFRTVCRQLQIYAPSGDQPALDRKLKELTDAEKEVDLFFSDQNNVDRLIEFLALEEKKGKDKFNGFRFIMFKVLCKFSMSHDFAYHSNNRIIIQFSVFVGRLSHINNYTSDMCA